MSNSKNDIKQILGIKRLGELVELDTIYVIANSRRFEIMELLYEIWNFIKIYLIIGTFSFLVLFFTIVFLNQKRFKQFDKKFNEKRNEFDRW